MKTNGSSRVIGGRSLWGNLFDVLLSKYHWTLDYLLWGISYVNVYMLLSDAIGVYSDTGKDLKESNILINADDPANKELIREMFKE